jgi:hypothetical protein
MRRVSVPALPCAEGESVDPPRAGDLLRHHSSSSELAAAYVLGWIEGEAEKPPVRGVETSRVSWKQVRGSLVAMSPNVGSSRDMRDAPGMPASGANVISGRVTGRVLLDRVIEATCG